MNFIIFVAVGIAVGWIAGVLVKGHGLGGFADLVVGILGALIGGYIFDVFDVRTFGFWGSFGAAIIGAVLLVYIAGLAGSGRKIRNQSLLAIFVILGTGLIGCSSAPPVKEFANDANPTQEIALMDTDLQRGIAEQLDVSSPENFAGAVDALKEAKAMREKNKDQKAVLHSIALSRAYYQKAQELSNTSDSLLKDVFQARQLAITAGSPQNFSKKFQAADQQLQSATRAIENGDTDRATHDRKELTATYTGLELEAVLFTQLGQAQKNLKEATSEGAAKIAPKTFAWAQTIVTESDKAIVGDRHNQDVLLLAQVRSNDATARLLRIVRQAKTSAAMTPEQMATQLETDQKEVQEAALETNLTQQRSHQQLANAQSQIAGKNADIAGLTAANGHLMSQEQLETQYVSARKLFTKEEADVYKQGNQLLLRLKGLSFRTARSDLTADNYPVLSKVQEVIKSSKATAVLVEGHTDSTGSVKANELLSQQRADSVERYLVANNLQLQEGEKKISAKGLGDAQPIATNKTVSGRSQNRRVDITITGAATE
jgi:outer membrane protein OmpA-like peptidoglycan-associated protein/uncharacterized membrane protein YeaQ/YmgE (transglycosylase-associated protein family)